jgi:hypothetical protein
MEQQQANGPQTQEELEQTTFFKAGVRAAEAGRKLVEAASCMRLGCWQQDAFIAGFDSVKKSKKKAAA